MCCVLHSTYEKALRGAGFGRITWHLPEVSDDGIELYVHVVTYIPHALCHTS